MYTWSYQRQLLQGRQDKGRFTVSKQNSNHLCAQSRGHIRLSPLKIRWTWTREPDKRMHPKDQAYSLQKYQVQVHNWPIAQLAFPH